MQVPVGRIRQVLQHLSRRPQANKLQGLSKVLEIDWSDIKGIDFANRLCEDGRLVLEAGAFQQLTFTEVCAKDHWTMQAIHFLASEPSPSHPVQQAVLGIVAAAIKYLVSWLSYKTNGENCTVTKSAGA